jgi:transposase
MFLNSNHSLRAMANEIKNMYQIKEIYRLLHDGYSERAVADLLSIGRNTVRDYHRIIKQSEYSLSTVQGLEQEALFGLIRVHKQRATPLQDERYRKLLVLFSSFDKELKRTGVTLQLLWKEYREKELDGYSYVQFCHHYGKYSKRHQATINHEHTMGECLMVDYAGDKMNYVDPLTGEVIVCEVLISILPYSGYTYAVAMLSQKQEDFVVGMNQTLRYMCGVSKCMLTDNLKTVVKKSDRYEPDFTNLMWQFGAHYGLHLQATRVGKPKDKGKVENAVTQVYRTLYAPLRDQVFTSLKELNASLQVQLQELNQRAYQGKDYSRYDLWQEERTCLKSLPDTLFEVLKIKQVKVQRNYHIELEKHFYSVPYTYVGSDLMVYYNTQQIQIYTKNHERITTHTKGLKANGYTTCPEHRPPNHTGYLETRGWNADYFRSKAHVIGPYTLGFVEKLFTTKQYIEQTYLSCMGLFRMVGMYSALRVENACRRLESIEQVNYKMVESVLKNNLDQSPQQIQQAPMVAVEHENLRNKNLFK